MASTSTPSTRSRRTLYMICLTHRVSPLRRRRRIPRFTLVAERVHDLSREGDAQREAMWNVEVPEAFKTLEAAHAAG